MADKEQYKSLLICSCCDKDTGKTDRDIEKVIFNGYTNMLCRICRMALEDTIADITRKVVRKRVNNPCQ